MLKLGLIRRIGDGLSTNAWHDNWIPWDHSLKPICCISDDPPQLVSSFIYSVTKTWNLAALETHMLPMDVQAIKEIPIGYVTQSDFYTWHYDRSGVFTVRSCYRMIIDTKRRRENYFEGRAEPSNGAETECAWKRLWKVQVPSKLRIFSWRLVRSSLPTGEVRAPRGMATTPVCPVCNATTDTWRHSLLDYNMSASVWALKEDDVEIGRASCRERV